MLDRELLLNSNQSGKVRIVIKNDILNTDIDPSGQIFAVDVYVNDQLAYDNYYMELTNIGSSANEVQQIYKDDLMLTAYLGLLPLLTGGMISESATDQTISSFYSAVSTNFEQFKQQLKTAYELSVSSQPVVDGVTLPTTPSDSIIRYAASVLESLRSAGNNNQTTFRNFYYMIPESTNRTGENLAKWALINDEPFLANDIINSFSNQDWQTPMKITVSPGDTIKLVPLSSSYEQITNNDTISKYIVSLVNQEEITSLSWDNGTISFVTDSSDLYVNFHNNYISVAVMKPDIFAINATHEPVDSITIMKGTYPYNSYNGMLPTISKQLLSNLGYEIVYSTKGLGAYRDNGMNNGYTNAYSYEVGGENITVLDSANLPTPQYLQSLYEGYHTINATYNGVAKNIAVTITENTRTWWNEQGYGLYLGTIDDGYLDLNIAVKPSEVEGLNVSADMDGTEHSLLDFYNVYICTKALYAFDYTGSLSEGSLTKDFIQVTADMVTTPKNGWTLRYDTIIDVGRYEMVLAVTNANLGITLTYKYWLTITRRPILPDL